MTGEGDMLMVVICFILITFEPTKTTGLSHLFSVVTL